MAAAWSWRLTPHTRPQAVVSLVAKWQAEAWAYASEGRNGEAQQANRHAQELAAALESKP